MRVSRRREALQQGTRSTAWGGGCVAGRKEGGMEQATWGCSTRMDVTGGDRTWYLWARRGSASSVR